MRRLLGVGAALLVGAWAPSAAADPQWSIGVLTGAAGLGRDGSTWSETCWFNGLRGDVLLGRSRSSDFGVGPYVGVSTAGFDDVMPDGGLSVLVPWESFVPLVASVGGFGRLRDGDFDPGIEGFLFIGSRSYNFHSSYGLATGLSVGLQQSFGDDRERAIIIAAHLDGMLLALPFMAAYTAVTGPPEEQ